DLAYLGFNTSLGLHDTAKYSVLARHSMATTELSVSLDKWNSLSPEHRAAFEAACLALDEDLRRVMAEEDTAALTRVAELGVTMIEFGEDEAAIFRTLTNEVWDDWGSRSEMAGRIVESHRAFLGSLGLN
ncbi:MAG: hypothetical protein ACK4GT_12675, partial [Pararhodobacter sp.]